MQGTVQLEKYFAASEITVLAVCFVMLILLTVSFKVRMKSFRIFAAMLYMLIIATLADLTLHYLMDRDPGLPRTVFYALRTIYHTLYLRSHGAEPAAEKTVCPHRVSPFHYILHSGCRRHLYRPDNAHRGRNDFL